MPFGAVILATLASAYVCYTIARERRADASFWVWMGILFGPLAIHLSFFQNHKRANNRVTSKVKIIVVKRQDKEVVHIKKPSRFRIP